MIVTKGDIGPFVIRHHVFVWSGVVRFGAKERRSARVLILTAGSVVVSIKTNVHPFISKNQVEALSGAVAIASKNALVAGATGTVFGRVR